MPDTTEEFDPKGYGFYYLTGHVAEKGFQAGSVVGTAALVPYAAFRHFRPRPNRDPAVSAVVQRALKLLSKSAGWGIVAAGALTTLIQKESSHTVAVANSAAASCLHPRGLA